MQRKIILTSPEELSSLIHKSVKQALEENQQLDTDYTSIQETSLYLNLSVQTIYKLTSKSQIPFIKKGKKLLFQKRELDLWLRDSSNKSK
jgi:excisionase family DNA binding protein